MRRDVLTDGFDVPPGWRCLGLESSTNISSSRRGWIYYCLRIWRCLGLGSVSHWQLVNKSWPGARGGCNAGFLLEKGQFTVSQLMVNAKPYQKLALP